MPEQTPGVGWDEASHKRHKKWFSIKNKGNFDLLITTKQAMIQSITQLDPNGSYTYADYLLWQFEERVELLRGHLLQMVAPSRKHQVINGNLHRLIANAL